MSSPDPVANWLESLGLPQYIDAFVANEIEPESLAALDHETLKELGVTLIGHRLKILQAVESPDSTGASRAPASETSVDERRQLTVMFCDLADSTELASRVEPEDLRRIISDYQRFAARCIKDYDGHVAQHLGDGLLAYFGYPVASEHAADRAVHAALAISQALHPLREMALSEYGFDLSIRIGIDSGQVVIGGIGDADRSETLALGEAPNIAARLQSVADRDAIVISAATNRLLNESFDLRGLGELPLKGLPLPITAYRVMSARVATSRFAIKHGSTSVDMTGRSEELHLLTRAWVQVQENEGQGVILLGDPGLGKSVLVHKFLEQPATIAGETILMQCSPNHMDSALYPAVQFLKNALDGAQDTQGRLEKLTLLLHGLPSTMPAAVSRFAWLLGWIESDSLPNDLPEETAENRRKQTLLALTNWIFRVASDKPLLLIIEDAHWIDPTTLELLDLLIADIQNRQVLLLITGRPEFDQIRRWDSSVTKLSLNRLARSRIGEIVLSTANNKPLPDSVTESIIDRADGVPLFAEELTKAVIESGNLHETHAGWEIGQNINELNIPVSLQGSLMARLDRASDAKRTAQVAACIGREFSYDLLDSVSPAGSAKLDATLESLKQAQIVIQRGAIGRREYFFRHALLRDSAYDSLVRTDRQKIHHLIAKALDETDRQGGGVRIELIAHHLYEAGSVVQAADHWKSAGTLALTRSENAEAVAHLTNAAQALRDRAGQSLDSNRELAVLSLLAGALIATKGYGSSEMSDVITRSADLIPDTSQPELQFPAFYNRWVYETVWSRNKIAKQVATEFHQTATQLGVDALATVALRLMGTSDFITGHFDPAIQSFERVVADYDPDRDAELAYQFGQDPKASALAWCAPALFCVGKYGQAEQRYKDSVTTAAQIGHANTYAYALYFGALVTSHLAEDVDAIEHNCAQLESFAEEKGLKVWQAESQISRSWLNTKAGIGNSRSQLDSAMQAMEQKGEMGMLVFRPLSMSLIADMFARIGQLDAAVDTLSRAIEFSMESDEAWYRAELFRKRAGFANESGKKGDAAKDLHEAVAQARCIDACAWELRAALDLGQLAANDEATDEARSIIKEALKKLPGPALASERRRCDALLKRT